jgi:hypothetical protein
MKYSDITQTEEPQNNPTTSEQSSHVTTHDQQGFKNVVDQNQFQKTDDHYDYKLSSYTNLVIRKIGYLKTLQQIRRKAYEKGGT